MDTRLPPSSPSGHPALIQGFGTAGAVLTGLGSIIGTGVFVSIGIAAGIAGSDVIFAIALAGVVAAFNALSSAQLAAAHPVSGGTYEYGYRYLSPIFGFSAGWMFLCAKSASAATAALGFSGYLLDALGLADSAPHALHVGLALATVASLSAVILAGVRLSNPINAAIVSITLGSLLAFVLGGLGLFFGDAPPAMDPAPARPFGADRLREVLHASALMFVAFTGYGRIATLGEEVRNPRRTIPRAILIALGISALLYISVAAVAVAAVGAVPLAEFTTAKAAPLEAAARRFQVPGLHLLVAFGAMTAMLGVLLNLLLGLSRVLMAMGRRRDAPALFARLNATRTTPVFAVLAVTAVILGLTLIGNVRTTWSFSAFTVLVYYAITNLAALFIDAPDRLYGKWVAVLGFVSCLTLGFWVDRPVWLAGFTLLLIGVIWHTVAVRSRKGEPG